MAYQDYFFLDRWVRHWEKQIGRENLYVLSHGDDPRIKKIAQGTNIIHIPSLEIKNALERRRWLLLSNYASGLTLYYNWVVCNDVDEIVALDPEIGESLPDYLDAEFATGAPMVISPFAIELVHTPHTEPDLIHHDKPILSARRNFRVNTNYAKPCITRGRINYSVGGHGCRRESVHLDDHIYLFHLRYVDAQLSRARLEQRRHAMEKTRGGATNTRNTWEAGTASFDRLSTLDVVAETIDFPQIREKMITERQAASTGNWFFGKTRGQDLYRLPERFSDVF